MRFHWKDYADRGRTKIMTLGVDEFLRRFLLHVLPPGFVRIRHFGLLANAHRRRTIACAQQLLGVTPPPPSADLAPVAEVDRTRCPLCHQGHWQVVEILRPLAPSLTPLTADTS